MTRTFGGQQDLTGRQVASLFVQGVITVTPLRYFAKCHICNSTASYSHSELVAGGRCKQPQCSLEQERQAHERQNIRLRQAARASWLGERYE